VLSKCGGLWLSTLPTEFSSMAYKLKVRIDPTRLGYLLRDRDV